MLLCHHGCGSESAFDHCSYFFSLFTTHSKGKVVNRLACEKALHLGGDARGHARVAHESWETRVRGAGLRRSLARSLMACPRVLARRL